SFQRRRSNIRPGLTGWAQINGGIEISWSERIFLDMWYVDHRSFWLDVKILWRTLGVILLGEKPNPTAVREATSYGEQRQQAKSEPKPSWSSLLTIKESGVGGPDRAQNRWSATSSADRRRSDRAAGGELDHLPVLDGFRGIAILMVLAGHALGMPFG